MKILHIITSLRLGGAERLVADMLPRLRERGHQVEVLLFDGTRSPFFDDLERQGIAIHVLGTGIWQMWNPLHAFALRRYLKRGRFDIVHTHNTPCQLLTALAAGKDAPLLVTTEHNTFNRRRNWAWYRRIDRLMYGRYRFVVCVGGQTRANLAAKLGAGAGMPAMEVINNGIDLSRFAGAAPDPALRTPAERDRRIIVMVAAFRPQKDQPTLIRAMLHLPDDYRLWLVGDWTLRAACERLTAELGLTERVRFWGFRHDVPQIYASSDIVVLSSHYEGMSLACIEAMASGKPFIASDVEGLREVAGGAGLLFPQGDHERLAQLIRQLGGDDDLCRSVARRCTERAAEFDIVRTVDAYERAYTRLVSENTTARPTPPGMSD